VALEDYRRDIEGCSRCSSCKWVPYNQIKSWRFSKNCPSIYRHNFHTYSGSGRMIIGLSLMEGRAELDEAVTDMIFRCQLCGACDSACKTYRDDIDISEVLLELRAYCVESGELLVEHMAVIDSLKREGNTLGELKAARGDWARGLDIKDVNTEQCDVLFHAGCRYSYDPDARETARGDIQLLRSAGLDIGVAGVEEACCGGRAYELGYRGEASNYADDVLNRVKSSGASMLVTACADCYSHFQYIYPKIGKELPVEVLHVSQVMERLLDSGRLRFRDKLPLSVTYHDPCHLGRKGEPYTGVWSGDKLDRPMSLKRSGRKGIYDAPRNVLGAMPGVELVEMERIREYAWCCGAGGGVLEAFPDFAASTTAERIEEALATGAEALVTACPWCLRVFKDAVAETSADIAVYDLADLALMSAGVVQPASV
jgi:heterodisulfide reductase subunit D